jgi:PKD repeat protein
MRNRAYLLVALLGLLTFALAPGIATAGQGKSLSEIALASGAAARAAAVSGPVISISPLGHDFGIVNAGGSASFAFTISNTGDATLNLTGGTTTNPHFTFSFGSLTVAPGSSTSMTSEYHPVSGVDESASLTVQSNASNGSFSVNVSGRGNMAPVLDPIGNKSAAAFVELSFDTPASDNNDQIDDLLTFSVDVLPPGATYNTSSGHFSWTPNTSDAGTYTLTFSVSDGHASDSEVVTITVSADNAPPVANAGGPYNGGTGQLVNFDGSASSDPDGNALTYDWTFGDGSSGSGATPSHAYAVAGNYVATLTVTDNGSPALSSSDQASVQILSTIPASINIRGNGQVKMGSSARFGMEINAMPVGNIDPNSVRMSTTYPGAGSASEIAADPKSGKQIGDLDKDHIPDLLVNFSDVSLISLLGNVPNNTTVTLVLTARTNEASGAIPVQGSINVVVKGGGAAVSSFASPNPFNPETAIRFTVRNSGPVSVRIYALDGRLVKTLRDDIAQAGTHEVRWNGTDNNGRHVPSGMYFVKTESGADKSVFKLSLLK